MRTQISTNVSERTRAQADELMRRLNYSLRDVMTVAIDRMYHDEIPEEGAEMTYSIGQLARDIAGGNERQMRKMLNDVGADPRLDEYAENPDERVSRTAVIDLVAMRAGDVVGRRAARVLGQ